ncbi:MAG: exodeoxyribonuclease III [Treponema sp.]
MKIVSWNVNGIRAAWGHGLSAFLDSYDADIYAFQETKTNDSIPMMEKEGYFAYWSFCKRKKGYSGTLCLTKIKPLNVAYDLDNKEFDTEGRIITLEFEEFYLVNCYVPNSQRSESRHDYRIEWDYELISYLERLKEIKPTIVCGDFNVAISENEVYRGNERVELDDEGFQSEERENLIRIVESGFVDAYRFIYPYEREKYSWWSNRLFKRKENRGWRLDYFFVSTDISSEIKDSTLLTDVQGSDHCPIILEIDIMKWIEKIQKNAKKWVEYKYADLLQLERDNIPIHYIKNTDYTKLWDSIDWEMAEKNLETMQMALAKSAYKRDLGLIEKWQKKIVYSIDAKVLAVRHICSTSGGGGIDNIKWHTSHEKMVAAIALNSKEYRAMPSRLLLIKSKNNKQRRIHIETYYDKAMQCLYAYALDPVAESWGDRKSFAYRKGRSTYDMNEYIKYSLSGDNAPEWIFIGDVRKCYENISHAWIKKNIPMAGYVLNEFLKAGYVYGGSLFPTDSGVGIGCSISPIVANMTLDGLPEYIYSSLQSSAKKIDYSDGDMIRYADDIIITARSKESAEKIKKCVIEFLAERGLELSEEKSSKHIFVFIF